MSALDAPGADELEALLQFLYMAPVGLVQATIDGEVAMMNPLSAQLLLPLAADAELGNLFDALRGVAPDLRSRVAAFDAPHGVVLEAAHLHVRGGSTAGGSSVEVLSLTLLKLDPERLMAVLENITAQVRRERELQRSQAWIHTIVDGVADYGLGTLDGHGRCLDWSASLRRVTGFDAEVMVGRGPARLCSDEAGAGERLPERLREADATGWSLDEGWMARPDGTRYWGSSLIAPLGLAEGAAPGSGLPAEPSARSYSLIVRDITHLRESRESLRQSVSCDHLTGLANRRAFFEGAEAELVRSRSLGRPLALVMIDADHFKRINDRHGHPAGDAVLRHLAAGLTATFRSTDLVARIGGEEFVALLPGADGPQAVRVAERLCRGVAAQVVEVDGVPIRYTVSAGVAAARPHDDGVDALLKRADRALYQAKHAGRDRVGVWSEALEPAAVSSGRSTP